MNWMTKKDEIYAYMKKKRRKIYTTGEIQKIIEPKSISIGYKILRMWEKEGRVRNVGKRNNGNYRKIKVQGFKIIENKV